MAVMQRALAAPSGGQVVQCPVSGCGGSPTILATGQVQAAAIAVDGTSVYWSTLGDGTATGGTILRVAR